MKNESKIQQRLLVYSERAKEIQCKLQLNHRKIEREILQEDLNEYETRISELQWVLNEETVKQSETCVGCKHYPRQHKRVCHECDDFDNFEAS